MLKGNSNRPSYGQLEDEMASHCDCCDLVEKHDQDLYQGNERAPGLVTRVEVAEQKITNTDKIVEQMNRRFWAIIIGIAGTLAMTILGILLKK